MTDTNACPACGRNIGPAAVFKALLPNRIFCPWCGARLRYRGSWLLVAAAVAFMVVASVAAAVVTNGLPLPPAGRLLALLGALVAAGVACEVAFVVLLWYGAYELEPVNPRPPDEWADDWDA